MLLKLGGLVVVWLLMLAFALSTGWNAVWILVYVLGLLIVFSFAWAHWNVAGLELRRRHRVTRVRSATTLRNRRFWRRSSGSANGGRGCGSSCTIRRTLPGHHLDGVISLGPVGRKVWELRSCAVVGAGSAWVRCGSPAATRSASSA